MPEKLISELLDLPVRVRKGDFVLNLSKGVTEPEKTLAEKLQRFENDDRLVKQILKRGNVHEMRDLQEW